jgi:hypothetical protein
MRRDLLLPTLEEISKNGMQASMSGLEERIEYLQKRMDSKRWSNNFDARPNLGDALKVITEQRLNTTRDYVYAAEALLKSANSEHLLLAHELSVIAMARKAPQAPKLFVASLDRFLVAIGQPSRYKRGYVAPGVARELELFRGT